MGSIAAQIFSGLSRDVRSGSSPGLGWAIQGHSETCPETIIKDDQWRQDAPDLNFESHSKGSEYLCKLGVSVFYF
jgi:hypothetical protein